MDEYERTPEELEIYQKRYRKLKREHDAKLAKQKRLQDLQVEQARIQAKYDRTQIRAHEIFRHLQRIKHEIAKVKGENE